LKKRYRKELRQSIQGKALKKKFEAIPLPQTFLTLKIDVAFPAHDEDEDDFSDEGECRCRSCQIQRGDWDEASFTPVVYKLAMPNAET